MKSLFFLLNRCLVTEFYQQSAGFFMVILLLAFGFFSSTEHIALAQYAFRLPLVMGIYWVLWALYGAKTLQFVGQTLRQPEYQILFHLRLVPFRQRIGLLLGVQFSLLLPAVLYAVFMVVKAGIPLKATGGLALIPVFLIGLTVAGAAQTEYWLRHPNARQNRQRFRFWFNASYPTPYVLFFGRYLLRHQPVALGLTKLASALLVYGVCHLYPTDDYDGRLLAIGVLLSVAIHAGLVYQFYQFEAGQLLLLRNLPIPLAKRFIGYALVLALLWLPELGLLLRYRPVGVSIWFLAELCWFAWGLLLLIYSQLLIRPLTLEQLVGKAFWGFVLGVFIVMFRVDIGLLGLLAWGLGYAIFRRWFWRAEWVGS
ncbi:MAG: hypothetical protein LH606_06795 [Cytophagaceae bacterium]|nr:hypothetical protein [Cytophagaceae bacterium]